MTTVANLVHQTSTQTGTGDFTLAAVNGKQSFDTAFGHGTTADVFDYFISNREAAEWERGTGHMSESTTLVRDTVKEGTNGTSAVSFSAGTKDVANDIPAGKSVNSDKGLVSTVPLGTPSLDTTGVGVTVANGANATIANSPFGLIMIRDASGNGGLFMLEGGTTTMISAGGSAQYVVSQTPSSGKVGVSWDGVGPTRIYNNSGGSKTFTVCHLI